MIQDELEGWAGQPVGPGCSGSQMEGEYYGPTRTKQVHPSKLCGHSKATFKDGEFTIIKLREWKSALVSHPDREYAHHLIRSSGGNMPLAREQAALVEEYLGKE